MEIFGTQQNLVTKIYRGDVNRMPINLPKNVVAIGNSIDIVVSGCLMYYIYKVECKTQEVLNKLNQSLIELKEVIESAK